MGLPITHVRDGDWGGVRRNFNKIKSNVLGPNASPTFTGLTLSGLTASQLLQTDANKTLTSIALPLIVSKGGTGAATLTDGGILLGSGTGVVTALAQATNGQLPIGSTDADPVLAGLTGTSNQITVTNGAGSITLSLPATIAVPGKVTAGSFGSPTDVTATREYGFELHYSGNNYNATGIRSRASAVTTDTTAQFQGGLFQAANNDGINVGVLNGFMAEAVGKSSATAATIATMRGGLVGTEWGAFDTVTNLRTLHIRGHTLNASGAGSFDTGYALYIENEAVGGNGQAYDAGIYFKGTNLSGGNKAFTYGIDFTGATYGTATQNWDATPVIQADGTTIIKIDSTNNNVFFGNDAFQNDNGQRNVGFGYKVGYNNDTTGGTLYGDANVYIGSEAGYGSGTNTAYSNVAIGVSALKNISSGYSNVAIGAGTLRWISTGASNVAIGRDALILNSSGNSNFAAGALALYNNSTGDDNVGLGSQALRYNEIGNDNVAIGNQAGRGVNDSSNTSRNVFIGYKTGYSVLTGGSDNIFIGHKAGYNQTTGSDLLIIDNQNRSAVATEITDCLIYGVFDATASSQTLNLNAKVLARYGIQTIRAVNNTTDPPTDAELDTAFGDPTVVGAGFIGILDDNDAGTDCYICWTTGTAGEWFYTKGTKAV